jgi:hypothetical protein
MKSALPFTLVIGLLVTSTLSTHAQSSETVDLLEGKWKLEMKRDTLGNAVDIANTRDPEAEPDIYSTIDFKNKKKAVLSGGNYSFNTTWEINGRLMSFYYRKKDIWVTFPIRSLNSNAMVLIFSIPTEDGPMRIEAYYRKL